MINLKQFDYFLSATKNFVKNADNQDIRRLQGVNVKLFGPQSWEFINKFMNIINDSLYKLAGSQKLGNQGVNFQTVIKTPTGSTRFVGSMKSLFDISTLLWKFVSSSRDQVYSVDEAKQIVNSLSDKLNSSNFPEPNAQDIKPKLIIILTDWNNILQNS